MNKESKEEKPIVIPLTINSQHKDNSKKEETIKKALLETKDGRKITKVKSATKPSKKTISNDTVTSSNVSDKVVQKVKVVDDEKISREITCMSEEKSKPTSVEVSDKSVSRKSQEEADPKLKEGNISLGNEKKKKGSLSKSSPIQGKIKQEKPKRNRKKRIVHDNETPSKTQTTLTQHFQVRRSERRIKSITKDDYQCVIKEKILTNNEDGLEVRVLEEKGRGVFSKHNILKGNIVCEYAGDLVDVKEARRREAEYELNPQLGSYMYFFEYKSKKYCVDATMESGRLGRLLNHSKTKSNVTTKLFPIRDTPHLILVAARDIEANEELLYDYGDRSKSSVESHPWLKS